MLSGKRGEDSLPTDLCDIIGFDQLGYVLDNQMYRNLTSLRDNPEGNAHIDKVPFGQKELAALAFLAVGYSLTDGQHIRHDPRGFDILSLVSRVVHRL